MNCIYVLSLLNIVTIIKEKGECTSVLSYHREIITINVKLKANNLYIGAVYQFFTDVDFGHASHCIIVVSDFNCLSRTFSHDLITCRTRVKTILSGTYAHPAAYKTRRPEKQFHTT